MGGSLKTIFPYPRNRDEGPTYSCMKSIENELLPIKPGAHGILVVKSLPDTLNTDGFTMFVKYKGNVFWTYCGTYKGIPRQIPLTQ